MERIACSTLSAASGQLAAPHSSGAQRRPRYFAAAPPRPAAARASNRGCSSGGSGASSTHAPPAKLLAAASSSSRDSSSRSSSSSSSSSSLTNSSSSPARASPLAAVLLSAVQVLAALQLGLAAPASADGGDFRISSQAASPEAAAEDQYFETVPQGLAAADSSTSPRLGSLIEGPKGKQIQQCTRKCVPTCIRGGQGAPGLGPMSVRKEIVVFKDGYRSRSYCLSECTQVCALSINGSPPVADAAK